MTALAGAQAALNAVQAMSPLGMIVLTIGVLITVVVACWNKFAGFRAFILTMWDTIKGFGGIIKEYVTNRINELLDAVGNVGKAIKLLFEGDFSGAANAVGDAAKGFVGVNSATQAYQSSKDLLSGVGSGYDKHLAEEIAKDEAKKRSDGKETSSISVPGLLGSSSSESVIFGSGSEKGGKGKGKGGRGKTGDAIATGGTRNTQITMNIGKLVERIQVSMMDKTDTAELERSIISVVNRSLAIATSTDR